ncbi:hypothetical protein F0562_014890 [Nyssa sinensis]|uniref:Uncharacterized protein n=1 Tax=Nyssa sinensis TaxID=561372 RepID=A0A5J4ZPN6_9ASTE|nr:hypothetical protein F0562_014890 [Nyssa sinensis]
MDDDKKLSDGGHGGKPDNTQQSLGTEDVDEALKRCLEQNKGDNTKCKSLVEAFKSPSSPPPPPPPSSSKKPVTPLRLRSGSLTDV